MKKQLVRLTVLAALLVTGMARAEMVYVATLSDVRKEETFQVMNKDELKALKQTVDAEAKVFVKALEATKKEWEAAEKAVPVAAAAPKAPAKGAAAAPAVRTGPRPFPSGMLAPRKVTEAGPFERAQADKKVQSMQDAQVNALSKSTKTDTSKAKKTDAEKKREELRKARELEQTAAAQDAALKLQAKIDELVKAAANPVATTAAGDDKTKTADAGTKPATTQGANAAEKTKAAK